MENKEVNDSKEDNKDSKEEKDPDFKKTLNKLIYKFQEILGENKSQTEDEEGTFAAWNLLRTATFCYILADTKESMDSSLSKIPNYLSELQKNCAKQIQAVEALKEFTQVIDFLRKPAQKS